MSTKNKIVEKLSGKGKLFEEEQFICDATYDLTVRQTIHISRSFGETEEVEGLRSSSGRIKAKGLEQHLGKSLTLHLEDGRRLNIFLTGKDDMFKGNGDFY
jgi:hypothetical protein